MVSRKLTQPHVAASSVAFSVSASVSVSFSVSTGSYTTASSSSQGQHSSPGGYPRFTGEQARQKSLDTVRKICFVLRNRNRREGFSADSNDARRICKLCSPKCSHAEQNYETDEYGGCYFPRGSAKVAMKERASCVARVRRCSPCCPHRPIRPCRSILTCRDRTHNDRLR